jgi:hypothetical protein
VSSNGLVQFGTSFYDYINVCLPTTFYAAMVVAYWDDLRTDGVGEGVFTATTGQSPNREFIVEWRAHYYGHAGTARFEVIFRESSGIIRIRYGADLDHGASATVGLQQSATRADQFSCYAGTLSNPDLQLTYTPA